MYVAFAIYFSFRDIPVAPQTLLCFAEFLLRSFTAVKSVTNTLSSVKRLHLDLHADITAFETPKFACWKRALPLTHRVPTLGAPPLALPLLERLCDLAWSLGAVGQDFAALLSITFFTMGRLSSLVASSTQGYDATRLPTIGDVRVLGQGFTVNLKWSKSNQTGDGQCWIPLLPRRSSAACPVVALGRLLKTLQLLPPTIFFFFFGEEGEKAQPSDSLYYATGTSLVVFPALGVGGG